MRPAKRQAAAAEAKRKELDANAPRPHRRGREGHRRAAHRRHVEYATAIATDAAAAIVERLAGDAPPSAAVAEAVAGVLKR